MWSSGSSKKIYWDVSLSTGFLNEMWSYRSDRFPAPLIQFLTSIFFFYMLPSNQARFQAVPFLSLTDLHPCNRGLSCRSLYELISMNPSKHDSRIVGNPSAIPVCCILTWRLIVRDVIAINLLCTH